MTSDGSLGCPEFRELSRRRFLGTTAAIAAAASVPAWLPRVTLAKSYRSAQRDVLISIFLRGAADGLTLCAPFSESLYYTSRPNIAVPHPDSTLPNRLRDLQATVTGPNGSVGFGLPPAMLPLLPAYQAGHLLFVHASGLADSTRSHFDAQRYVEYGRAGDVNLSTGWINRHFQTTPPLIPNPMLRAVSLTNGLPFSLRGGNPSLAISDLADIGIGGLPDNAPRRVSTIQSLYNGTSDPLRSTALSTFATIDLLSTIDFTGYVPAGGAAYPATSFAYSLKTAAALIKAQVGVEAIAIDLGEWDTHANQGTVTGNMANAMTTLALGLAAFHADMFGGPSPTFSLVCMSEFGRRLRENASLGTDHGHGNVMLLMGGAIRGGRVLTRWPGLQPNQLFEGIDLEVTTDYRDVFAEIAANRLGNTSLNTLFPGHTPIFQGVTT